MSLGIESREVHLEDFRPYLMVLARVHWDKRLQCFMEPADLVQQTLLEAHKNLDQYKGHSDWELRGWLRTALRNNLLDALKKVSPPKRPPPRGAITQLVNAVEESAISLENLAAEQSTPSEHVAKDELLLRLAAALEQLPECQREAITLHKLQKKSLAYVAGRMGRTQAAVAGLLRRGLKTLRELLRESE
jgi:RNA polymerase sigma-70 factor (ECF subfamily)